MPLDHTKGEIIADFGHRYIVVDNHKWRETPLFEEAARMAGKSFLKAGALWPVRFDDKEVLTQEYPETGKLVMVFMKTIRDQEHFYWRDWDLPPEMQAELRASGQWQHEIVEN